MRVNVSADFGSIYKSAVIYSDTSFFFGFSLDFSDLLWYGIILTGTEGGKRMKMQRYTVQYTPHFKKAMLCRIAGGCRSFVPLRYS